MTKLLTLLFISISVVCFGQAPKKDSKGTIPVTPNAIQIEKLNDAYAEKQKAEFKINELTELIIGYKLDEIDSLRIDQGQFKFILKPKKK